MVCMCVAPQSSWRVAHRTTEWRLQGLVYAFTHRKVIRTVIGIVKQKPHHGVLKSSSESRLMVILLLNYALPTKMLLSLSLSVCVRTFPHLSLPLLRMPLPDQPAGLLHNY